MGSDSSLELLGESMHELRNFSMVVVGLEVGEGVVASAGSESHVLLDKPSSGNAGSGEGGSAVEERKISEVVGGFAVAGLGNTTDGVSEFSVDTGNTSAALFMVEFAFSSVLHSTSALTILTFFGTFDPGGTALSIS